MEPRLVPFLTGRAPHFLRVSANRPTPRGPMDAIRIRGTRKLQGRIQVSGAKNAALPILCATLLSDGESLLRNVPGLRDIETTAALLRFLGREVTRRHSGGARARRPARRAARGAVRAGAADARQRARARAARGALRPRQGLAARRLSDRRAPGRSAPDGARGAGRQDLGRARLHLGRSFALERRRGRVRHADRDRHRESDDGRRPGQRALDLRQLRARAGGRRARPRAEQDGRASRRRGHVDHSRRRRGRASRRSITRSSPTASRRAHSWPPSARRAATCCSRAARSTIWSRWS